MKLTHLKVEGLFNQFDYSIPLDNEENLTIITGPNGYGKTMMLNIVNNLFLQNMNFFKNIVFETITLTFENSFELFITKEKKDAIKVCVGKEGDFRCVSTEKVLNSAENFFLSETKPSLKNVEAKEKSIVFSNFLERFDFFSDIEVHLIKEQRLEKLKTIYKNHYPGDQVQLVKVIHEYANELVEVMTAAQNLYVKISQELDSTFPKRLLNEKENLKEDQFNERFQNLKEKQDKLNKYNILGSELEVPEYNAKDAKVLFVYLKDSENKVSAFDDLIKKLDAFTSILNDRRFAFKTIKIDKENGFQFQTESGIQLELSDLSSGEQHEVVLLFELIFRVKPGSLVLIDEPELSLHVTWQREFLRDMLEIMSFQKMQVIIATHSPQIINDRWDLVYNLEKVPA